MFFPEDLYIARIKTSEDVNFHSLKQNRIKVYLEILQHVHLRLQEILFDLQEMPGLLSWKPNPIFPKTIKDILWDIGILLQKATVVGLQQKEWRQPKKPRFLTFVALLDHLRKSYMALLNQILVFEDEMLENEVTFPDNSRGKMADLLTFIIDAESKFRGQIEIILDLYRLSEGTNMDISGF